MNTRLEYIEDGENMDDFRFSGKIKAATQIQSVATNDITVTSNFSQIQLETWCVLQFLL